MPQAKNKNLKKGGSHLTGATAAAGSSKQKSKQTETEPEKEKNLTQEEEEPSEVRPAWGKPRFLFTFANRIPLKG